MNNFNQCIFYCFSITSGGMAINGGDDGGLVRTGYH